MFKGVKYNLQITTYKLLLTNYYLQITTYKLLLTNYRLYS